MNWSATAVSGLLLGMVIVWCVLLVRMLRVPPGVGRAVRVLEGQGIIVALNGLVVVAARLWPTYPYPYAFSVRYFLSVTVPYAMFHGLPFLLFFFLTMLPAILALAQARARRQRPPSRPALGG